MTLVKLKHYNLLSFLKPTLVKPVKQNRLNHQQLLISLCSVNDSREAFFLHDCLNFLIEISLMSRSLTSGEKACGM